MSCKKMKGLEMFKEKKWHSPSGLCTFSRCPARYFFASGCRLRRPTTHVSLAYGKSMHAAIPLALREGPLRAIEAFRESWGDNDAQEDRARNSSRAEDSLSELCLKGFPWEVLEAPKSELEGSDTGLYEIPFAIDVGLDRPFMGKIDGWGRHRTTGKLWGLEYKTSRSIGSWFFDSFRRSPQLAGYSLALSTLSGGEKVEGIVLVGIQVAITKTDSLSMPFTLTDHEISSFVEWMKRTGEQIEWCERHESWPETWSACSSYPWFYQPGGQCEFLDLCQSSDWTQLADMYEMSDHEPFWIKADREHTERQNKLDDFVDESRKDK